MRSGKGSDRVSINFVVIDVDGTLTDGSVNTSILGKAFKSFCVDDHDAINLARWAGLKIFFISGDSSGFDIASQRIRHMGGELHLVSSGHARIKWIQEMCDIDKTLYIGDGIFDNIIFNAVGFSASFSNSLPHVKVAADYVSSYAGGSRGVADILLSVISKASGMDPSELIEQYMSKDNSD